MGNDVYDIDRLPANIIIGKQTENGVTPVSVSVERWIEKWGDMAFSVWHAVPDCDSAYQAQSHMEGDILVWDVTDSDTMRCGCGKVIIMGTLPTGERKLSATRNTVIYPSVPMRRDWYPPENQQPWFVTAMEATRKAQKAQQNAEAAADKYPKIGASGNWLLWDVDKGEYVDSGVSAGGGSGGGSGGTTFTTDETLTLKNGVLSVNRAEAVEQDNTLPITSAAVYTEVGNINALLATI